MTPRNMDTLALRLSDGVGEILHARLVAALGDASAVLSATEADLRAAGAPESAAQSIRSGEGLRRARHQLEEGAALGARLVCRDDPDYPAALTTLRDAPPVLWVRGALPAPGARAVAIVGTRAPDGYGLAQAMRLAAELAERDAWVVSGGAAGIDGAAHEGALHARGQTLVVCGAGLDVPYPPQHAALFERVVERGGGLVSELPLGAQPTRGTFPRRNRLIAALSEAVVVVQAALRSGALITADLARAAGRPVLAVPGPVDRAASAGVHRLLREGARVCEHADDALAAAPRAETPILEKPAFLAKRAKRADASPRAPDLFASAKARPELADETAVLEALGDAAATFDELAGRTGLGATTLAAQLLELELVGRVSLQRGYYVPASHSGP